MWSVDSSFALITCKKINENKSRITESRFWFFHFSLFHYCFKDFPIFLQSSEKYALRKHISWFRHKLRNLNLCVTYTSLTHSHTHPGHPLTLGTRQNVTNSSCLLSFFVFPNHFKNSTKYPFDDNRTTTKFRNLF